MDPPCKAFENPCEVEVFVGGRGATLSFLATSELPRQRVKMPEAELEIACGGPEAKADTWGCYHGRVLCCVKHAALVRSAAEGRCPSRYVPRPQR